MCMALNYKNISRALGLVNIKHTLKLSDEATIERMFGQRRDAANLRLKQRSSQP